MASDNEGVPLPLSPEEEARKQAAAQQPSGGSTASDVVGGVIEAAGDAGEAACCLAEASLEGVGLDCFVATAALGDQATHPDLDALRAFRDRVLLRSRPGRLFARLYYRWGSHAARAIRGRRLPRALVREGLVRPMARLARRITPL